MWTEILRHLRDFPDGVLTWLDETGYPFSVRCAVQPDAAAQVLRVQLPEVGAIQAGPASFLCHRHDERLWNIKSFAAQGAVERDGQGWIFRPRRFIPGIGIDGVPGYWRWIAHGRRTAKRYLARRGWPRPRVPWGAIMALVSEANKGG